MTKNYRKVGKKFESFTINSEFGLKSNPFWLLPWIEKVLPSIFKLLVRSNRLPRVAGNSSLSYLSFYAIYLKFFLPFLVFWWVWKGTTWNTWVSSCKLAYLRKIHGYATWYPHMISFVITAQSRMLWVTYFLWK